LSLKIIYAIGNLDVGGSERHLAQVLPRLIKHGFAPTVYTITHKGRLAPALAEAGVEIIEPYLASTLQMLPSLFRKPLLLLSSVPSYFFLLLRLRPAIVHFFLPQAYLLGGLCSLAAGKRIRIMSRRSLNRYQLKHRLLARVERWLHPRMDAVLGNSKAVVEELKDEGVPARRLGLLYNGIDLAQFDNLPSRSSMRQSLGISEQTLLLVCVANLMAYKGHGDLVRALGAIRLELPGDWMIAMVGRDSGIGADLRKLAELQGIAEHVLWLGERSDAVALYAAAEIGVLSSHEEGFSNSVLEGMAAGAAMVVTDVGGNGEAVLDGECGLVVPARNPPALGKAILALVTNEGTRQHLAHAGRQRVLEKFTLDACVGRYAALYRALLRDSNCTVQAAIDSAGNKVKD